MLRSVCTAHMGEAEARPFFEQGERELGAGNYAAAERLFAQAIAAAADSAVSHSKRGVALVHLGRVDEAIAEFSRAVALQPGYAQAYSNLGNVYREKGQLTEAIAAYERALAIDPDYWVAHQNLGSLYKQMGRLSDAVAEFKKATRLSVRQSPKGAVRRGCFGPVAVVLLALVGLVALLR